MNIQEENSAHYFRVQSEHEQTLISNIRGYVDKKKGEIEWINHAIQLLLEEKLVKDVCLSWSSFHASQQKVSLHLLLYCQGNTVLTDAVVKQLDFHAQVSVNVVDNVKTIR